jgi:hypothetical protein
VLRSREPSGVVARARRYLSGSPGVIRWVLVVLLLGSGLAAGAGAALLVQDRALVEARDTTAHLVLVQAARTGVVEADANATNAFLRGGLEPPAQRQQYLVSLAAASRNLALAARFSAQSSSRSPGETSAGDDGAYARANDALARYAGLVEAARADNRQGLPVGASYLKVASSVARTEVAPELTRLGRGDESRVDAAFARADAAGWWFAGCSVAGVALLVAGQARLARLTHRVFTVPAAATTASLVLVLLVAAAGTALAAERAGGTRDGRFAATVALAEARVAAYDAKALESVTLSSRGSDPGAERTWAGAMDRAAAAARTAEGGAPARASADGGDSAAQSPAGLGAALERYAAAHREIRGKDLAGDWDGAVELAVATGAGSANAVFADFDRHSATAVRRAVGETSAELAAARSSLPVLGLLVLAAALLAAAGGWRGVALRLEEYA